MSKKTFLNKQQNIQSVATYLKPLLTKEIMIALYFLIFIFGMTSRYDLTFYNEYRVIEVALMLFFALVALLNRRKSVTKIEGLFFAFIAIGGFFWLHPNIIITDLLLAYLLYKCFQYLDYNQALTKLLVIVSLLMFIQLPFSLWSYVSSGVYEEIWYPLRWNIRVYNSYFFIMSIFAVWFYTTEQRYSYLYLLFLFLTFLSILLDAGRSATLAYTVFIAVVSLCYSRVRWPLLSMYGLSWTAYLSLAYLATLNVISAPEVGSQILRTTTSLRYDLWMNAYQCWSQHPILGCGFYQLEGLTDLAAHPHNLFIQVLSEAGLIGFGFLVYLFVQVVKRINWHLKSRYFVIAALLGVSTDMFFSGIHIYPVTQIALLWLFVFLLKNPKFVHTSSFDHPEKEGRYGGPLINVLPFIVYIFVVSWFIYLFITTQVIFSEIPLSPPRFWMYGYKL